MAKHKQHTGKGFTGKPSSDRVINLELTLTELEHLTDALEHYGDNDGDDLMNRMKELLGWKAIDCPSCGETHYLDPSNH
jgi:hypothetical protein